MEPIRVFFTGNCEVFDALRDSLDQHPEIEVVGATEQVAQAVGALAGGHLDCVLHATGSAAFPATEVAAIREQTRAPRVLVASGGEAAAMLENALDSQVDDVLLLPQLTHNVVFAIRKAAHVKRQVQASTGHT